MRGELLACACSWVNLRGLVSMTQRDPSRVPSAVMSGAPA